MGLIPLINRARHTRSEFTMSTYGAFKKVQGLHFFGVEMSEKTSIVAAQLLFAATPFPLPPPTAAGDGSLLGNCSLISSPWMNQPELCKVDLVDFGMLVPGAGSEL